MKLEPSFDTLQAQVELRVLVGPQAGSSLSLGMGDYSLGTSDECEIILMGSRLESVHARISFDGDQITVKPVEGKVCDAQGNEIMDTFPLTLGMPVDLGGVWVSVDSVDARWPDPADVLPTPAPPSPVEQTVTEREIPTQAADNTASRLRNRAKITLIISAAGLCLIVLAGISLAAWMIKQQTHPKVVATVSKPVVPTIPVNQQKILQIIQNLDLAGSVEMKISEKGSISVSGYLPDSNTKKRLTQALDNISPSPKTELYVDSDLLEAAKKILADKLDPARAKLKAEGVTNGVLKVRGAVSMQTAKESAYELVKSEVPGVRQIDGFILQADDLPQQFQEKIISAGLAKKLQVVSQQPEFVLRGTMNEEELRNWETVLTEFNEDYGKILPIRATIRVAQKKSPFNVQIVVGGNMPFVITESGQRVTRGGDINGHTLITIKDTEVIFDGNEKIKISR
jgi:type III secretion system YscD/HrpQ family protein